MTVVAQFNGFAFKNSDTEVHADDMIVCFDMFNQALNLTFTVDLPVVEKQYQVWVNKTNDPQNEEPIDIDGFEVALIKTEYSEIAVGKITYFDDEIFAIDGQPVLIDEQSIIEINQWLEDHASTMFKKERENKDLYDLYG